MKKGKNIMEKTRGIIVVDAGHGEKGNPHTTREGFYEGTQNYKLSLYLRDELVARGFEVKLTREQVTDDPELMWRGGIAGEIGAIMFISLHSNAPATNIPPEEYIATRGVETYYSVKDLEGNAPIAKALNDAVIGVMNTADRGIKIRRSNENPDEDFYRVIRSAANSGCVRAFLVEHGFHTNPEDSAMLQSDEYLARIAKAEAEVIDKFF